MASQIDASAQIDLSEWRSERTNSGYLGVSEAPSGKFKAQWRVNNKMRGLGTYDTAEEAARAVVIKHTEVITAASLSPSGSDHMQAATAVQPVASASAVDAAAAKLKPRQGMKACPACHKQCGCNTSKCSSWSWDEMWTWKHVTHF